VLDALLDAATKAGVELIHPWRITEVVAQPNDGGVVIVGSGGRIWAKRVILCTGGMALPRSGSDGAGYAFARAFGHGLTDHITPALVPLIVDPQHFVRSLSGLTVMAELSVQSGTGKRLESFTNSTLCTHFGLSGPGPLDVSRYYFAQRRQDVQTSLVINWIPGMNVDQIDELLLRSKSQSPMRVLTGAACELPERLARAICEYVGVDGSAKMEQMTKQSRRGLAQGCASMKLPIAGDRGFTFAEVTAGGVPLSEVELATMRSKKDPRAYLAGEICDVDGRIGGFNFQWAWASGFVAGCAAAKDLLAEQES
jgi:predicted Rossmann fold flavoprotein